VVREAQKLQIRFRSEQFDRDKELAEQEAIFELAMKMHLEEDEVREVWEDAK
jgi:hypothetical protein